MQMYDAASYLEDHGHEVTLCAEGLLVIGQACYVDKPERGDDKWFEEPMCFPIDREGNADFKAIRDWLGY